jgi:hypothetical protein
VTCDSTHARRAGPGPYRATLDGDAVTAVLPLQERPASAVATAPRALTDASSNRRRYRTDVGRQLVRGANAALPSPAIYLELEREGQAGNQQESHTSTPPLLPRHKYPRLGIRRGRGASLTELAEAAQVPIAIKSGDDDDLIHGDDALARSETPWHNVKQASTLEL